MNRSLILLIVLLLFSCEREIYIDPVNVEQELVVNAFIQPGQVDSLLLTSTFSSLTSADFFEGHPIYKGISGAKVVVLANGDTIGRYVEAKNLSYHYEGESFDENKEYQLEITHPDYPSVSANTTVPVVPDIWFGTYAENGMKVNTFSTYTPQVLLVFEDNMDAKDYYLLTASYTNKRYYPERLIIDSINWIYEDVMIEYLEDEDTKLNSESTIIEMTYQESYYDFAKLSYDWETNYGVNRTGIFFSDKLINGQKISIPVDIGLFDARNTTSIHLTLTAISEEYYLLIRSLATLAKTNDGFFPEALQLYGNVHNGHGLWAAKSSKTISLDISELDLFNYE